MSVKHTKSRCVLQPAATIFKVGVRKFGGTRISVGTGFKRLRLLEKRFEAESVNVFPNIVA